MSSGEEVTTETEEKHMWEQRDGHIPANAKWRQREDGYEPNNGMWLWREDSHEPKMKKRSQNNQPYWHIDLHLQSTKSWENKLLLTSPSLRASVMGGWEN